MVERWLRLLNELPALDRHPDLCLIGAWVHALRGRAPDSQRWADAAKRGLTADDPRRRLLHALRCSEGTERMLDDAAAAYDAVPPGGVWEPTALVALGVAHHLAGDDDSADATLARRRGGRRGRGRRHADRRAQRALVARGRTRRARRRRRACRRGERDRRLPPARRVGDACARARGVRARRAAPGRPGARRERDRACASSPSAADARRPLAVGAGRHRVARTQLTLADVAAARSLLLEIDGILRLPPRPAGSSTTRPCCVPRFARSTSRTEVGVEPHLGGSPAAAARHASLLPRDRRPPVRLAQHGEDAGDLGVPQVRRLQPERGDRACGRARSRRRNGGPVQATRGRGLTRMVLNHVQASTAA